MSKGNLFLGLARKSVGDVTFYRAHGEQITRARNRNPKNPRTPLQLCQRVLLRTASQAYSLFQPIADHSFQGREVGTANQSRFIQLNVQAMREQLVVAGDYDNPDNLPFSEEVNFAGRLTPGAVIRPYIISEGSLQPISYVFDGYDINVLFNGISPTAASAMSYNDIVYNLGLQAGDQLTFVWVYFDDSLQSTDYVITDVQFSRVILYPAAGGMDTAFLASDGSVNSPNPANSGGVFISDYTATQSSNPGFKVRPSSGTIQTELDSHALVGFGLIVSRNVGGSWLRSNAKLILRATSGTGAVSDYDQWELGDAIMSYMTEQQSSLYLNQAKGF